MRDADILDLPAIVALLADDESGRLREDASLPLDPRYAAAFEEITQTPNHRLIVAENGGGVVGTMQLSFLPGLSFRGAWRMQIEAVRIASAQRSQGFGRAMILWAIAEARARKVRLIQLTSTNSRTRAHAFYERLGFSKSHVGMKFHLHEEPGP